MSDGNDKTPVLFSRRRTAKVALTVAVGSAAAVLAASEAKAGYGACSISGCYCRGFMGNQDLCANCGHQYPMHW